MINLFERYDEATQDLHQSLMAAGIDIPTIVIDDNGHLPSHLHSPYGYFLGDTPENGGKPRFFNQIDIPEYWEIIAANNGGEVLERGEKRANIFYVEPSHRRLVRTVEWLDKKGTVRSVDYYNQYGRKYAHTTYAANGQATMTTFYNVHQKEAIVENHITGDMILHDEGKIFTFLSKIDFIRYYLQKMNFDLSTIIYNRLSLPFFIERTLPHDNGRDILVWQEPLQQQQIPGNMLGILHEHSRTKLILVQNSPDLEIIQQANQQKDVRIEALGTIYQYQTSNHQKHQALIMTNSDQIEQLEWLIQQNPNITFNIGAITEMSNQLLKLSTYHNVALYPNISQQQAEQLFQHCKFYLDINYGNEILNAVRTAFLHQQLILRFNTTAHNIRFGLANLQFNKEQANEMMNVLQLAIQDANYFETLIHEQQQAAGHESIDRYRNYFNI